MQLLFFQQVAAFCVFLRYAAAAQNRRELCVH